MRALPLLFVLAVIVPTVASAQLSTTSGFTAFDQRQFAKLNATVGTWTCRDVPASKKPDIVTTARQGNYFVSRETGDYPNTTYTRWSHTLKAYYSVSLSDQGGTQVFQTTAPDPNNAAWTPAWPSNQELPKNQHAYPYTVTLSGNTITGSQQYRDSKGKLMTGKSVCTKS